MTAKKERRKKTHVITTSEEIRAMNDAPQSFHQKNSKTSKPLALRRPSAIMSAPRADIAPVYLTKRILISVTRKAFTKAAEQTMETMGYNLIADQGWLIKIYKDGRREPIRELETVPKPSSGKIFD